MVINDKENVSFGDIQCRNPCPNLAGRGCSGKYGEGKEGKERKRKKRTEVRSERRFGVVVRSGGQDGGYG